MEKEHHGLIRPCTLIWLLLLVLTFMTYAAAELGLQGKELVLGVLVIALITGQLVSDWFMGLRRVRGFWRPVLGGYFLIVGSLIAVAFLLPQG